MKVVFISIARVLATFDILPPVDENGKPRMPPAEFTKELIRYGEVSHPLRCSADLISSGQSSHAVRLYRKTSNRKFDDSCHGGVGESTMIHTCLDIFPSFFPSVCFVSVIFIVRLRAQKPAQQTQSNTEGYLPHGRSSINLLKPYHDAKYLGFVGVCYVGSPRYSGINLR